MNWTKQKPGQPGFYWVLEEERPIIVEVRTGTVEPVVLKTGDTRAYAPGEWKNALWCGPLEPC